MEKLDKLIRKMLEYEQGNPGRAQHFIKVHSFARIIGSGERLGEKEQYTLEAAAIVHDIGIRAAKEKYGKCNGRMQEEEGPAIARKVLEELGFEPDIIDRVCYLVGHHHTYSNVDGLDYRILLEADFIVNAYEYGLQGKAMYAAFQNIFGTATGKEIYLGMFDSSGTPQF